MGKKRLDTRRVAIKVITRFPLGASHRIEFLMKNVRVYDEWRLWQVSWTGEKRATWKSIIPLNKQLEKWQERNEACDVKE